ncbi:very short patch repair endonuclease [Pseudomonas luteola]|uniref:very short patch repair endonuclease n=1 Tax=Pseudomonas luteola TaxID=47886 RepID=UPI002898C8F9|nr:very short patch repair endonuclease [Pseudomonas luteola]
MDVVDRATRSRMMSGIRGKNTRPEIIVRKFLHACGYRFRLHRKDLPGRPDIVLPRFKTCIFIHGCFWHHHKDCKYASLPKTRADFWAEKLQGNVERDQRAQKALIDAGWRVLTIWECELKKPDAAFAALLSYLEAVEPQ